VSTTLELHHDTWYHGMRGFSVRGPAGLVVGEVIAVDREGATLLVRSATETASPTLRPLDSNDIAWIDPVHATLFLTAAGVTALAVAPADSASESEPAAWRLVAAIGVVGLGALALLCAVLLETTDSPLPQPVLYASAPILLAAVALLLGWPRRS
jgi:hypothetical protein